MQLKNTKELVFLSITTDPIISSFNLVGAINFISKDIVTQGILSATLWAAVPAPASIIEAIYPPSVSYTHLTLPTNREV